jgi:hypothetical protein
MTKLAIATAFAVAAGHSRYRKDKSEATLSVAVDASAQRLQLLQSFQGKQHCQTTMLCLLLLLLLLDW